MPRKSHGTFPIFLPLNLCDYNVGKYAEPQLSLGESSLLVSPVPWRGDISSLICPSQARVQRLTIRSPGFIAPLWLVNARSIPSSSGPVLVLFVCLAIFVHQAKGPILCGKWRFPVTVFSSACLDLRPQRLSRFHYFDVTTAVKSKTTTSKPLATIRPGSCATTTAALRVLIELLSFYSYLFDRTFAPSSGFLAPFLLIALLLIPSRSSPVIFRYLAA
ncbi:hypothetical protein P175DRAFT_0530136 [Aspergillus ochraceoroseus IBT 24754]|uniref:Uncharacterized protein n=1 Tax=Aspergillus ochraceoroseus IBT 24754 TaxID=1392256 RepID=A0A2T5M3D5_9EURO|nr:uncharacterized protein P175DRAFT_0530136 [Aspergillus ochraceoroseus IBT 24754]PTU23044.1 hypothetical protein P175DRAFT_0530136 [Aspergillus ochraceoroseus IBT 24754]